MERKAEIVRETKETTIRVAVNLDRFEPPQVETNLPLLSHFFSALSFHSGFAVSLRGDGDVGVDPHHLVEDVGIAFGQALRQSLQESRSIRRFGEVIQPMDEALVLVAVDISGRGQFYQGPGFPDRMVGTVGAEVWPEFFHGLARSLGATLHLRRICGENAHHTYEACFKGTGRALGLALLEREDGRVPSTKGVLA